MLGMADAPDPSEPRPVPSLTPRQRAALKARAHALEPVVRIGHAGLTDAAIGAIDRALEAHELIKVRLGDAEREERAGQAEAIAVRSGAAVVQRVGRVLAIWRPRPEDA